MPKHSSQGADCCCGDIYVNSKAMMYYRLDADFLRRLPCIPRCLSSKDRLTCFGEGGGPANCMVDCKELVIASKKRPRQMLHPLNLHASWFPILWLVLSASVTISRASTCPDTSSVDPVVIAEGITVFVKPSQSTNRHTSPTWTRWGFPTRCCQRTRTWRFMKKGRL